MQTNPYSHSKVVKKRKLGKNRKPSDVFQFLLNHGLIKPLVSKPQGSRTFLPSVSETGELLKPKKKQRIERAKISNSERRRIREEIQREWPPGRAAQLTKKQWRSYRDKYPHPKFRLFCDYIQRCKRGQTEFKKRKEGKGGRRLQYDTYINSPLWEAVKNRYYKNNARRCAACYTYKYIQLHHMVYGNFGDEKDDDLVPLCATHHKAYHDRFGTHRDMIRTTNMFIEETRALLLDRAAA